MEFNLTEAIESNFDVVEMTTIDCDDAEHWSYAIIDILKASQYEETEIIGYLIKYYLEVEQERPRWEEMAVKRLEECADIFLGHRESEVSE
jgi:hypothetical protein